METIRVCGGCRSAENPKSQLTFHDTPSGALCDRCFQKRYFSGVPGSPLKAPESAGLLVVVNCPPCGGSGSRRRPSFPVATEERCRICLGYGSVRVPVNALAVYRPALPASPSEHISGPASAGKEEVPGA